MSVLDRAHLTARHKHPLNIVQVKIDFTSFSTNLTARITAGSLKNQNVLWAAMYSQESVGLGGGAIR